MAHLCLEDKDMTLIPPHWGNNPSSQHHSHLSLSYTLYPKPPGNISYYQMNSVQLCWNVLPQADPST